MSTRVLKKLTFKKWTNVLPNGYAAALKVLANGDLEKVDRNATTEQAGEVWNEEGACGERIQMV